MLLSSGVYDTFVIRIFRRDGIVVHGEIVHIATRQRMYFSSLQSMVAFINAQLGSAKAGDDEGNRDRP